MLEIREDIPRRWLEGVDGASELNPARTMTARGSIEPSSVPLAANYAIMGRTSEGFKPGQLSQWGESELSEQVS